MPRVQGPLLVFKVNNPSVQSTGESEDAAVDFNLGALEGIALYRAQFNVIQAVEASGSATQEQAHLLCQLHRRVGTLEADSFATNSQSLESSEVIHEYAVSLTHQDITTSGANLQEVHGLGDPHINFMEVLGEPLILGGNLTIHLSSPESGAMIVTFGVDTLLYYKRVRLSLREQVNAFISRRL